ncbi:alpha/beta hydrolase [Actinomycetospora lemnae]|uniref:Alpha/beta hydrolase n=1 Tax=Actinomycetospora lemnae TaxID=3019891 RepID=A0ABT5SSC5_9PSEU|nr:alpha/beta hydrolase [Actinomycetospora sp. DW7H6]MDD7965071.1 alpha/beta hydrolase [Actinomycetospora sp. DW7H6]
MTSPVRALPGALRRTLQTELREPGARTALLVGTVALLVAGSGLRPLTRRWPAAVVGSLLSSTATETPRATAVLVGAAAGVAVRRGAAGNPAGRVGLGAAAAAVAVLLALDRGARADAETLADALSAELGPVDLSARGRVLGSVLARRRYASARDVAYGPDPVANLLDVWRDPELPRDARAPVLLQIHGGAWSSGSKAADAHPLMAHLVARGWVCVSVDYRLGPAERWPAQIVDVKRALAWTRAHIAEHGGDPDRIAITGGSSGAHLAALAALTPGAWQPGFADADTSVAAAVCLYGIYDLTSDDGSGTLDELLAETMMPTVLDEDAHPYVAASPAARVHPDAPPFMVLHGTGDAIVVPAQSRAFVARLRAVSRAPVVHAELARAQHGFDLVPTARTLATVRAVTAFLEAVMGTGAGTVVGDATAPATAPATRRRRGR